MTHDPVFMATGQAVYDKVRALYPDGLGSQDGLAVSLEGREYKLNVYSHRDHVEDVSVVLYSGDRFQARAFFDVSKNGVDEAFILRQPLAWDTDASERLIESEPLVVLQAIAFQLELRSLDRKIAKLARRHASRCSPPVAASV